MVSATLLLVVSLAAFASASIPSFQIPEDYNPLIHETIDIDDGKFRYGFPPLRAPTKYGCWYLRFKVKASNTVVIRFSVEDGECEEYYDVFIGMKNNQLTCVRRSTGEWLLDIKTPYILTGDWQYFYISQSNGYWSIGFQNDHQEIASFHDDNVYPIRYIGIKSLEWSGWSFYYTGLGRNIIKTDIHKPGEFKWNFPEFPRGHFEKFIFAVKAGQSASIAFSPTNSYGEDVYELMFGVEKNTFSCLRRKKDEKPIIDVVSLDIVSKDFYRYFWVSYDGKGHLTAGLYGLDEPIIDFYDDQPLEIKYYGVTSFDCESWWKFYTLCPDPQYVCQDEQFNLHCDSGLVDVTYALYGRGNRYYCPGDYAKAVDCGDSQKSLEKIREHCRGKQNCVIDATNDFFGNPCSGTSKYLRLEYTCCVCN